MILADTSVWIDYFNGKQSRATDLLDEKLDKDLVVMGEVILLEILQGFRSDKEYKLVKETLLLLEQRDLLGKGPALKAAEHYRILRKQGITIKKTNDVVIASYCIEQQLPLLFTDRDFQPFVNHLGLNAVLPPQ